MELSNYAMNLGEFFWKVNMAKGKKAVTKGTKVKQRTSCDRLEFTLVDQTVGRFVRPDNLFVF